MTPLVFFKPGGVTDLDTVSHDLVAEHTAQSILFLYFTIVVIIVVDVVILI